MIQCISCSKYTKKDKSKCSHCGAALWLKPSAESSARVDAFMASRDGWIEPPQPKTEAAPPTSSQISCPKCGSNQITAIKKGFGLGKALIGGVLAGGVGLLGGFIGSRKVSITCLNCGNSWDAGKQ